MFVVTFNKFETEKQRMCLLSHLISLGRETTNVFVVTFYSVLRRFTKFNPKMNE